jgi:hypothetical protein
MITTELTVITGSDELGVEKCLEIIRQGLHELSVTTSGFDLYGEAIDIERAAKLLKKDGRTHFLIEGNGWQFHRVSIRNYAIDRFAITAAWESLEADKWMAELGAAFPIRQAWVVDTEYDHWQNAHDPLQYTSQGRPYKHLPMRSNGLPSPLERTIIDTSRNPGRRVLRVGYVEAVGSPMWFGSEFWRLTGMDKNKVVSQSWTRAEEQGTGVLRIQPSDRPFSSSEGALSRMQEDLRSLIYPKSQ